MGREAVARHNPFLDASNLGRKAGGEIDQGRIARHLVTQRDLAGPYSHFGRARRQTDTFQRMGLRAHLLVVAGLVGGGQFADPQAAIRRG